MANWQRHRRALIVGVVAILLIVGVTRYFHWWDRSVETSLGQWAVAQIAERTRGVYTLALGDLDFRPFPGSLSFDSAVVTTDTALNRRLGYPLPTLFARATGCRLSKVSVVGLMLLKRFDAGAMGCEAIASKVELAPAAVRARQSRAPPPPPAAPAPPAPTRDPPDSAARQILKPPLGIRKFEISNIAFPSMQFSLRRMRAKGEASFNVAHARFMGTRVEFDPTARPGTPEAFVSVGLRLGASDLLFKPDPLNKYSLGELDIGLSDSTLMLQALALGPTVPDDEWSRQQKKRRDRIRLSLDSLAASGLQYRTLVRTGEFHVRRVLLNGLKFNILSDKRLPSGPSKPHVTPQAAAQKVAPAIRIDSIVIANSTISYLERKAKRDRPGQLDFANLAGSITNVDLPSSGQPLVIDARTRLMGAGPISVHLSFPLDAPDFRFDLAGRLGAMPAAALNPFLEQTTPVRLKNGQIDSITFAVRASGSVSKTTLTPYYRDLGIDVVSQGGVGGFLKAGVFEFAANSVKVRGDNPGEPNEPARSAKVSRRYEVTQSWLSFLWLSLRDGLLKAVVK